MAEPTDSQDQGSTTTTAPANGENGDTGRAPTNNDGNGSNSNGGESWIGSLPEQAQAEIRRTRAEAARYRTERNGLQTKVQEFEDASKTQAQKDREEREALAVENATLKADKLRAEVAADKGLTLKQARRLQGSTRDELEKDADELLTEFGGGNGDGQGDEGRRGEGQGQRRDWGQGARGTRNSGSGGAAGMNAAIRGKLGGV
jgi:hypothetical protein